MNKAYIAHIYAFSEEGPRYDALLSPKLEKDFSNLMLVCDECHRTFDDKSKVPEYPAERLIAMKKAHEERIELLTSLKPDKRSHMILYGAKIGQHGSPLNFNQATAALLPNFYPSMPRALELGMKASFEDHGATYWNSEDQNLVEQFNKEVAFVKGSHEVQHFSVFGLAPQPLLIRLGTLLSDIYRADVYQLHREPSTWRWLEEDAEVKHVLHEPSRYGKVVALKFELSATIADNRVSKVLGEDCAIWSMTQKSPNNDYLRTRQALQDFRSQMRKAFDRIKAKHGEDAVIHVFPALPVAAAIELGRVWMPKADLPMILYDQNRKNDGFFKTITITP
ncbi:MAG: SAVED domain-containing protein [Bacteroidota bacterium]|nr:SAVED domain-containing protein [Bacteroidota bacterium]MDX5431336.1 SAVED domain-containing protein [Bacteroidota bacterium]